MEKEAIGKNIGQIAEKFPSLYPLGNIPELSGMVVNIVRLQPTDRYNKAAIVLESRPNNFTSPGLVIEINPRTGRLEGARKYSPYLSSLDTNL